MGPGPRAAGGQGGGAIEGLQRSRSTAARQAASTLLLRVRLAGKTSAFTVHSILCCVQVISHLAWFDIVLYRGSFHSIRLELSVSRRSQHETCVGMLVLL